ncbi:interleukin-31 receptor subunit alpha [Echinops telfairi]|uniref:Interleukin-31 receptor subunit alpha n=1 Tax=Echinops telfairi TaxID=9371 RepID=A0ABM0IMX9_ECHTE|nr:interleukin-31 receptor subunit alpha [Echinops telfairi]
MVPRVPVLGFNASFFIKHINTQFYTKLLPQPARGNSAMTWTSALGLLLLCGFSLAALPHKPENISCIFYYKHNLTCAWSPEKETSDTWYFVNRTYCYGKASDNCTSKNQASCSFPHPRATIPDNFTIEVEAQNANGMMRSDKTFWLLDNIVKIEPPEISYVQTVLGVPKVIQVKWNRPPLAPISATLKYTLRYKTVSGDKWKEVNFTKEPRTEGKYNLTGLQAFTEYVLALRCAAQESRFWSDWSQEAKGTTGEQVPLGLDLWRVLGPPEANGGRPVQLLWKAKRGPVVGKTLGYNIRYFPENRPNLTTTTNTTNQDLEVFLGNNTYCVFARAYNSIGKSQETMLRIPAIHEKSFQCMEVMQTCFNEDQLVVEWQSSDPKVDTWIVEWLPELDSEPVARSWEVVSQARNWTAPKDKLKPFLCYNISIYPMFQNQVGEPCSIQAYVKEGVPSAGPVTNVANIDKRTVTVTWKEIPKSQRNGFIINYTIFYQAENGEELSMTVNSNTLQCELESLARNTPYTVQVMASTIAGGANGTRVNFKTLSLNVMEIFLITSLVGGGLLILLILTVAYGLKNPNKLKHLCWPVIPNPAESRIAAWPREDFKNKLSLKMAQFASSLSTEDRILALYYDTSDLIDKLVVSSENFLEGVSTEELLKHQKNIVGEGKNEYVISLCTPDQLLRKSFHDPLISPEIPPREPQDLFVGMPEGICSEANEQLLPSDGSLRPDPVCQEGTPNPYLKNSVTTREFLASEGLPGQTERDV